MSEVNTGRGPIAYVLKMYPRFSETFIVSEILAREAAGEEVVIFSMRPPIDPRFHPELARVQAPVIYVNRASSARRMWEVWQEAASDPVIAQGLRTHVEEFTREGVDDVEQALAVAMLAREHGVRHMHAHFASMSTTIARLASLVTGIPYSFTAHAKDIFHESADEEDLRRKFRDAHHSVTISDYNRRDLERRFGEDARTLRLIYNGLELERFAFEPHAEVSHVPRLLSVGRLIEKKGFHVLLDAMAQLRERGLETRLSLVGEGAWRGRLEQQSHDAGLADAVEFLGSRTQAEIIAMFASHDLFVAPFVVGADGNADGLPTVLLEAMASGIPIVAASVTAVPEVIIEGETGFLTPTGSVEEFAAGVQRALDPSVDRLALAARARELVIDRFDSAKQARALAAAVNGEDS